MLSDFGKVTVVDLTVSLLGVMVVLPAALAWAEEHGPFTAADFDPRRALRAAVRGRALAEDAAARLRHHPPQRHGRRRRGSAAPRRPHERPAAARGCAAGASVPEDRFGDLGPGGEREPPRAAERLADLDAREPESQQPAPRRPAGRSYTWVVGVAAVILIAVVGLNSLPNAGEGIRGPRAGDVIPAFAAPSATGPLEGDVNLKQSADDNRFRNKTAACDVREPGVVNVCDLRERGPVVLVFIGVPGAKKCEAQLDRVDRIAPEFRGVSFVGVASGRDKKTDRPAGGAPRLEAARGGGRARRPLHPVPGGDLPDDRVRPQGRQGERLHDQAAHGRPPAGARARRDEARAGGPAEDGDRAVTDELDLERGWVAGELGAEFPELALVITRVEGRARRSPGPVRERMREASNRFNGARAIAMRQQPIPWAYRVFFRHIGIDPDETRTPVEAMAVERLQAGGFKSRNTLDDGLLLALIETGVPVVAFDADRVEGELGLRLARDDERLGPPDGPPAARAASSWWPTPRRPLALLFGEMAPGAGVTRDSERMLLAAVQVKGVPAVSVEEALWTVVEVVAEAGAERR